MFATLWNQPYNVPHRRFRAVTDDGVTIAGVHVDVADTDTVVIYAHGFLSNKNHRNVPRFVELLSREFDVMAFDFRGHGESEGSCTFTNGEVLDIEAVVRHARLVGYERVVTVGSSMGGAAVICHAGLYGGVDGLTTIGTFDDARTLRRPMTLAALNLLFATPFGPTVAEVTRGTRLGDLLHGDQPIDVVAGIVVPTLFIHGEWDHLIHPEASRRLYERATEPKTLVVVPRKGHDMPHLSADTVELLADWITQFVEADGQALRQTVEPAQWSSAALAAFVGGHSSNGRSSIVDRLFR